MGEKPLPTINKIFLFVALIGGVVFVVTGLLSQQKGDVWWDLGGVGWYIGAAAIITHAIILPSNSHPMLPGMKIGAIGFAFIAFGDLFDEKIEDVMWTIGGMIMVIGFVVAFFGFSRVGKGN